MTSSATSATFCRAPFDCFEVLFDRYTPCCQAWLDESVQVFSDDSSEAAWNSPQMQTLRAAMLEGNFRFCLKCPKYLAGVNDPKTDDCRPIMARGPLAIEFGTDETCNLRCWSCRARPLSYSTPDRAETFARAFLKTALSAAMQCKGDPFASPFYRNLLLSLKPEDLGQCKILLFTNGLLLPRYWPQLKIQDRIKTLCISVDAATRQTYEEVRAPGKWRDLLAALDLARQLKGGWTEGRLECLQLNFAVRARNFREMPAFIALAKQHAADAVWFGMFRRIWHCKAKYLAESLCNPDHPCRAEYLETIARPEFHQPPVVRGQFLPDAHDSIHQADMQ